MATAAVTLTWGSLWSVRGKTKMCGERRIWISSSGSYRCEIYHVATRVRCCCCKEGSAWPFEVDPGSRSRTRRAVVTDGDGEVLRSMPNASRPTNRSRACGNLRGTKKWRREVGGEA